MKREPPLLLIVVAVAYLAFLSWMLLVEFTPVIAGWLAIPAILYFVAVELLATFSPSFAR